MMGDEYRPVARPGLEKSEMGDETLLYNAENDKVSMLNKTAAAVWELCDGKHTIEEIAAEITESLGPPEGRDVKSDVEAAIEKFREDGILHE